MTPYLSPAPADGMPNLVLTPPSQPLPSGAVVAEATHAPSGGGLRVAEVGHTVLPSPSGGDEGTFYVSIGLVIENTSESVAYGTKVTLYGHDDSNRKVIDAGIDNLLQIPVIMPGQRVGLGIHAFLSSDWDKPRQPASLHDLGVTFGATFWTPAGPAWAAITATSETLADTGKSNGYESVQHAAYTSTSPYCRQLTPHGVAVLFRDASGKLIGGGLQASIPDLDCHSGVTHVTHDVVDAVPPGADMSRSEVYPYCDPAPSTGIQLAAPGIPGNYSG